MRKFSASIFVVGLTALSTPAFANEGRCAPGEYWRYASSVGDVTPLSMNEWLYSRGCLKSDKPPVKLSAKDLEYMAYSSGFGDATPVLSYTEYFAEPAPMKPRKKLTAEDRAYIDFANSHGDGTPPSFSEWRAKHR